VSSLHAYLAAYWKAPSAHRSCPQAEQSHCTRLNRRQVHHRVYRPAESFDGRNRISQCGAQSILRGENDGSLNELKVGGIPLGMLDMDLPYETEKNNAGKGERILFYTDGITEAANEHNDFYDDARPLSKFFLAHKAETAQRFIADLIADIKAYTGSAPQSDDITALYLHRKG